MGVGAFGSSAIGLRMVSAWCRVSGEGLRFWVWAELSTSCQLRSAECHSSSRLVAEHFNTSVWDPAGASHLDLSSCGTNPSPKPKT